MKRVEEFLNSKPLAYKEIDLKRMPKAFEYVQNHFKIPEIVHIVGTNGKGTTGRFLAQLLGEKFRVGHYSSPHIFKIVERFWRDGDDIGDEVLEEAHQRIWKLLPEDISEKLSYFEYTTLLNLPIFENCDFLILEAGLGGEFDATAVFPKKFSIVTPIGFDHQSYLGNSISEIAGTKLRAMGKRVLISKQKFPEVYDIAEKIGDEKKAEITKISASHNNFLKDNFETAKKMAQILGVDSKKEFYEFKLPKGRVERVAENIIVDVGHNLLSAERVLEQIEWKKFVLVYNSFEDKPYQEILALFKNRVSRVEILEIEDDRIIKISELESVLEKLGIKFKKFEKFEENENYLLFGSFRVVENFYSKRRKESI